MMGRMISASGAIDAVRMLLSVLGHPTAILYINLKKSCVEICFLYKFDGPSFYVLFVTIDFDTGKVGIRAVRIALSMKNSHCGTCTFSMLRLNLKLKRSAIDKMKSLYSVQTLMKYLTVLFTAASSLVGKILVACEFLNRVLHCGAWVHIALYKYMACWLLSEEQHQDDWDGVHVSPCESATDINNNSKTDQIRLTNLIMLIMLLVLSLRNDTRSSN